MVSRLELPPLRCGVHDRPSSHRALQIVTLFALAVLCATACLGGTSSQSGSSTLTVWVDDVRTPGVQMYMKLHPDVKIHLVTIPNQAGYITTKIGLANQSKSGWPDVVFTSDAAALAYKTFDYSAPLNGLVSQNILDGFKPSLDGCTYGGQIYCLVNDLGQTVLWYNKKLMDQFGYQVPQTWADYQAIGLRVAKEHPGYIIGLVNSNIGIAPYFTSSNCPMDHVIDSTHVQINTGLAECTRVANLLQPLASAKVIVPFAFSDPGMGELGKADKVLMMPGPSWFGQFIFKGAWTVPAGEIAAADTPLWPGSTTPTSGNTTGGQWAISKHQSTAQQQAAANLIVYLTTDIPYTSGGLTYPAYNPAAAAWCPKLAGTGYYAADPCPAMTASAANVSKVYGLTRYTSDEWIDFTNTVTKAIIDGTPIKAALITLQSQLVAAAQAQDYSVVS